MITQGNWKWWAGSDEEWMSIGPCDTREEVIADATSERMGEFQDEHDGEWKLGFHITEARQDPLRIADWIEADRLLERADESLCDSDRVSYEHEDGPWFDVTIEQGKDLEERIKRACDEWQAEHRLVFTCATFSASRNGEHIVVPHPNNDEVA